MQKDIYNKKYFDHYYGDKVDFGFYNNILSLLIKYGCPGISLDLGCGLGYLGEIGNEWGIDIINMDLTTISLERNRDLKLIVSDITKKIDLPEESIHNVIMNNVFEHLDKNRIHSVLDNIKRILLPGGKLFIIAPSKYNIIETKKYGHINLVGQSELENILDGLGFKEIIPIFFGANTFFTNSRLEGRIVEMIYNNLMKLDMLNKSASCIATKPINT